MLMTELLIAVALVLLAGCQRDISGSYLARDQTTVCWLQLVRTPDNHLIGQMAVSSLKPDGDIGHSSVSLTGAVDGENVTLSGSGLFGLQTITLSGTFSGNKLTLTGVESVPVVFKRTALTDYQAQMTELNAHSQSIRTANAAAQAAAESQQRIEEAQRNRDQVVAEIDRLIGRMQQFDSEADLHLSRFPGAEKQYQNITAKMTEYVERERQLAGNPNASNTRAQLSVAVNQATILTEQMHTQGQTLQTSLEVNVKPIVDELNALEQRCRGSMPTGDADVACSRLANVATPFRQKYDATVAGLAHLEQVYQREHNTQQELVQKSQRFE